MLALASWLARGQQWASTRRSATPAAVSGLGPRRQDGMGVVSLPLRGECPTTIAALIGQPVPRSDICHAAGAPRRGATDGSDVTAVEPGRGPAPTSP